MMEAEGLTQNGIHRCGGCRDEHRADNDCPILLDADERKSRETGQNRTDGE